ncbi:MAG: peptide chain release factor 3 [Sulfobacillus thermosulfidooxidans]|uniref:peptide chain release factor 3 n=1 Tax=Sulfobacillus TaxID=28033 RepID=UPI000CD1654F|nr:peptide chain release factor 3 [Sulfobacillus sp. hq2]MCY0908998.1 peptide chain release factor 3 [Sulfobacillus thermotolerans]POB11480.1 peptide chain release factor 3 [Sulfobacillus sp. hq2]PSR38036.1 MAG: peptide chain release factor 3 [Sulfobacillus thermosulfidooxidans]
MTSLEQKIKQGRTFAIISHPDAGKTTLTEKLLLFGGAIREAGAVKARRQQAHARSDWMAIEQQRGISVTSTVLQFFYNGYRVNLLDTPGHQDFSEDTYRTLLAADSAVMVIDAAKGVEPQTIKLFEVAAKRHIPVFTFINKLDREGKDPWDLLQEIERVLGIQTFPMNWPVGMGLDFRGIYDVRQGYFEYFDREHQAYERMDFNALGDKVPEDQRQELRDALELMAEAGETFAAERVNEGQLSPVFFGSAIANFGVQNFLDTFLELAPPPTPRMSQQGPVPPESPHFSGFVFKIQANMNPQHRDRIAFVRIASGRFERGMAVTHVRTQRVIRLNQPQQFLAQDRFIVEEAYAGDVIGLHDAGLFHIGDTLTEGSAFEFTGFPRFSPEHFAEVELKYALKHKQYQRGLKELTEEGLIQVFHPTDNGPQVFLGVVGPLQFEVLEYRMKNEYGVDVNIRPLPYTMARWIDGPWPELGRFDRATILLDTENRPVLLVEDPYTLARLQEKVPSMHLYESSDHIPEAIHTP